MQSVLPDLLLLFFEWHPGLQVELPENELVLRGQLYRTAELRTTPAGIPIARTFDVGPADCSGDS